MKFSVLLRSIVAFLALATAPVVAVAQCPAGWVAGVGVPGVNTPPAALAVLPDGQVLVGGGFTTAGGIAANRIARYNPATGVWSALGSGTDNAVYDIVVLPSGDAIVAGGFTTAGGVAANRIARYNPTTGVWSALGSGTNSDINALALLPGGDLIVGGGFTMAGGVAANRIARYNPTTGVWSALGAGLSSVSPPTTVSALAVLPGGDVIVGGSFTTAGGVSGRNNIARVNPTTNAWSALGAGVDQTVSSLAVLTTGAGAGDVIIGGSFSLANGAAAARIVRYRPSTGVWSTLGTGVNNLVFGLTVMPGGDVLVMGNFTSAGGVSASRIARYNPTSGVWSALGTGLLGAVGTAAFEAAVIPGGDVLVGGFFTTAGGASAANIARFSFGSTAPAFGTQPSNATICSGSSATLSVSGLTGTAPLNYVWQVADMAAPGGWRDLNDGTLAIDGVDWGTVSGSRTPNCLFLHGVGSGGPNVTARCVVTNSCGSVTSNPATLTVLCSSDFDCNGTVDVVDLFAFLDAWFAQNGVCASNCSADFDGNNTVDVVDLFDFLDAWFAQNGGGVCG